MTLTNIINCPVPGSPRFEQDTAMAIARIRAALGPDGAPSFSGVSLSDLTASRLVYTDADKVLSSAATGTSLSFSAGTLNTVQGIRTTDSPTFAGLTLTAMTGVLHAVAGVATGDATLDLLGNPAADKTFNCGNNSISFNFIDPSNQPAYDGAFEIQASGAFTGDLFHVHQHTGNPGVTDLCHFEATDTDVTLLRLSHTGVSGSCLEVGPAGTPVATINNAGAAVLSGLTLVNSVTEFSTDGTLGDNSDTAVPTEKAVKTYVGAVGHAPVTLGTANGLSLDGQELSLPTTATPTFAGLVVNSSTPNQVTYESDGNYFREEITAYKSGITLPPQLVMRKAEGTKASPSAVRASEFLFDFLGYGYGATGWGSGATLRLIGHAAENWTDAAQGSYWTFSATPVGSTSRVVVACMTGDGRLGVNTGGAVNTTAPMTNVLAQLHVDQPSATAAIPVALLDQADVDQPFIKFIGTAASATLTNSLVAAADVTTATVAGYVKVEVRDDGNQITDQVYYMPVYTLA